MNKRSWYWVLYKQAIALWGKVKDTENKNCTRIAYYKTLERLVEKKWKMEKEIIPMLRYYNVYNVSQCEWIELPEDEVKEVEMNMNLEKDIETYLQNEKIGLFKSNPCYDMILDKIGMPDKNDFIWLNERYQAYFHEICHSTGAESRLKRKLQVLSMDKESYSKEELTAEIGASILMNENWLEWNKENTQAYINGRISNLEKNPQTIISAGNKAFRCVEFYLANNQPKWV